MKNYPGIDYDQQPASYWRENGVLASLLKDVKGTQRRRLIEHYWRKNSLEMLPDVLLQGTLPEPARVSWGQVHPLAMGGEYLPDCGGGEVEIARLELCSTTGDVISIRAHQWGARIRYRIVDEYETEFNRQRKTSISPFTLGELVQFIDGSRHPELDGGLALCYNDMNADGGSDRERLRHFTTVLSPFYPQLEQHYEHVFAEWAAEED
jgi:hypothetical protein